MPFYSAHCTVSMFLQCTHTRCIHSLRLAAGIVYTLSVTLTFISESVLVILFNDFPLSMLYYSGPECLRPL